MGYVFNVFREHVKPNAARLRPATDVGDGTWTVDQILAPDPPPTRDEIERLTGARHRLNGRQQRILTLCFDEHLSDQELAGFLGLSPVAARVAKHRALAALRVQFNTPAYRGGGNTP